MSYLKSQPVVRYRQTIQCFQLAYPLVDLESREPARTVYIVGRQVRVDVRTLVKLQERV